MCRRTVCSQCGKPSFSGCGMHVDQVLGDVKKEDRCQGHPKASSDGSILSWLKKAVQ